MHHRPVPTPEWSVDLDSVQSLLVPELFLPIQTPQSNRWTGEHRLCAAVLCLALDDAKCPHQDAAKPCGTTCRHGGTAMRCRRRLHAMRYIMSDALHPLSFLTLCDLFHLEPEAIRMRVRAGTIAQPNTARQAIQTERRLHSP